MLAGWLILTEAGGGLWELQGSQQFKWQTELTWKADESEELQVA